MSDPGGGRGGWVGETYHAVVVRGSPMHYTVPNLNILISIHIPCRGSSIADIGRVIAKKSNLLSAGLAIWAIFREGVAVSVG